MKLWISAILLFCVAQTLTNPVQPETKGIIEDIIAAEEAINVFIDITDLVALLNEILTHLNDPIQLGIDIVQLEAQIDKLKQDYTTAFSRILAELKTLEQAIMDVLVGQPIEIVNSIMAEIAAAEATIMAEYHKVFDSLTACLAAGEAAVAAIYAIIS
ncbi:hypothetical protein B566_EDAN016964 [Ephemera danica]|nr:hypothetical protein B566_EDAN016964 [Ephemera danica]